MLRTCVLINMLFAIISWSSMLFICRTIVFLYTFFTGSVHDKLKIIYDVASKIINITLLSI